MLHLYFSKQLQQEMNVNLPRNPDEGKNKLDWYAGFREIVDVSAVIVVCPATRFSFVIWDVRENHLANLGDVIAQGIRDVMASYGFNQEAIDQIAPAGEPPELYSASIKKLSMSVRSAARIVEQTCGVFYDSKELIPTGLHRKINGCPVSDPSGRARFVIPFDEMKKAVQELTGKTQIRQTAMVLEFPGAEDKNAALTVSADITFQKLGSIMSVLLLHGAEHLVLRYGMARYTWLFSDPESCPDPEEEEEQSRSAMDMSLSPRLHEGDVFCYHYISEESDWTTPIRVGRIYENTDTLLPVFSTGKNDVTDQFMTQMLQEI